MKKKGKKKSKVLLLSGANFFANDSTLKIEYPNKSHASTHIKATKEGDLKWIELPIPIHKGKTIEHIAITYRIKGEASFISQIRLAVYKDADQMSIHHDDGTDHASTVSAVAESKCMVEVDNTVHLSLRLNFGNTTDIIIISSVAISYR